MEVSSFVQLLLGRGVPSELANRIASQFSHWEALKGADISQLKGLFTGSELAVIQRAKKRREISQATVNRLVNECEFRCCLCWNLDSDSGVIIHHIRSHAEVPDDKYENLVVLCPDHHDKVHTKRELARHPYPPELLLRKKKDFVCAIAEFRAGKRVAPGRENKSEVDLIRGLPLPSPHFVGQDDLVRDVIESLVLRNGRSAIVGMGGVGKTALALKVADTCRERFSGGVLWGDFAANFGGVQGLLRSWSKALGQDFTGTEIEEHLALFGSLLRNRMEAAGRMLLLIDDVDERFANELVRLASYVPPDASILVTTRAVTIGAALAATQFRVEPMERETSRKLIESISGYSIVHEEEEALDLLLSLVGDLPLAIELLARQIAIHQQNPNFSIAVLCRRLEEFDSRILSFPGHRGIAMSFSLSYEYLSSDEQRVFRALGIFAQGPIRATDVAATTAKDSDYIGEILDRFAVVSVINWGSVAGEYRLHPLLHKYAEFLLESADESELISVSSYFYHYYTSAAMTVARERPADLSRIDGMFANLTRAVRLAADKKDHSVVVETILGLCFTMSYFASRNLDCESLALLELAAASAKSLEDADGEAACFGHLGSACWRLGMISKAVSHLENAIKISRKTGNQYDLASHLQNLGATLLSDGRDPQRAEKLLHEALNEAQHSQNIDVVIGCFNTLGSLHRGLGDLRKAADFYRGALQASRLVGNRISEGNNLSNLGLVIIQLGDSSGGEKLIREALGIAKEAGDKRGEGNRTGHLGGILSEKVKLLPQGDERTAILGQAWDLTSTALKLAQEIGDVERMGNWELNLGNLLIYEGKPSEAMAQYERALCIAESGGFGRLIAQARYNLG